MAWPIPAAWRKTRAAIILLTTVTLMLGACAGPRQEPASRQTDERVETQASGRLIPVDFAALPGWRQDKTSVALAAFQRSCAPFMKKPATAAAGKIPAAGQYQDWQKPCAAAEKVKSGDDAAARRFFTDWFRPYALQRSDGAPGLFTGYYEIETAGSRKRGGPYQTPIYRLPLQPVGATRAEIERGALKGRGLELLWLKDPVDAFILHIQGSGRVLLPTGGAVRIGYAGNNGHAYFPIGRAMVAAGLLQKDAVSLQTIRAWLKAHPADAASWMNKNERYVFFQEIADQGMGPRGALGVPLTPGRSLAVDPEFVPLGAPVWLDTTWPADNGASGPKKGDSLRRLMMAQDIGSAIKGPARGDVFWGSGARALEFAGPMRAAGRYFILLPKSLAASLPRM